MKALTEHLKNLNSTNLPLTPDALERLTLTAMLLDYEPSSPTKAAKPEGWRFPKIGDRVKLVTTFSGYSSAAVGETVTVSGHTSTCESGPSIFAVSFNTKDGCYGCAPLTHVEPTE